MSQMNKSSNTEREQWEQREQPNDSASNNRSQQETGSENNENIIDLDAKKPTDTEAKNIDEPKIKRPSYRSHPDEFKIGGEKLKAGLYLHITDGENNEVKHIDIRICSPLEVLAITSSPFGSDFGRLLRFIDSNGGWHEWAMPMHMLKSSSGEELCGELLNQGLVFDNDKSRKQLISYLMSAKPKRRITAANTVGWHNEAFVLPHMVIGSNDIVFQSEIAGDTEFLTKGTLLEWQNQIGTFCEGNIPLMVSIATCLAGPLLKKVNKEQGAGVHWIGDSSIGKSTALEVGGTVWGPPEFIRTWSTTSNGFEGLASARNDTCAILDEINEASPHDVGKIAYMLTNGQGKQRANRIGGARKIHRWRLMAISSGEKTLESIIRESGKQTNSGQIVRLLNIDAKFKHGVFDNLHSHNDGRSLADHLKAARLKYYGHVGPAFVRKLIDEKQDLPLMLDNLTKKFLVLAKSNLEKRAAGTFALISLAGELGITYGLLPWRKESVIEAAFTAFNRWRSFQGTTQTEDQKILDSISNFIDKHGSSRFSPFNDKEEILIRDRAGWYQDVDNKRIYMFTGEGLEEAGNGYERSRVIDSLRSHKWIIASDSKRHAKKTRIGSESKYLYYVHIPDEEEANS